MPAAQALPERAPGRAGLQRSAAVALLILVWLAATGWARPLMLPDEGRYVGVAWEMLRSGDWSTPTLDGLPFFHKPPLFYWISAAAMRLFGAHAWAGRAPALAGAWAAAFALYLFARRWAGARQARLAVLVACAQPLLYVGGQFANMDMLVAGCIAATVLCAAHSLLCLEQGLPHRRALWAAHALAALGVLAKGLIGAVIPLLVLVAWLLALRRWRRLPALVSLPGLLIFLAVAAPWFVAMQLRHPAFLDYFFIVQHFKRYVAAGFNNVEPFWFYPAVLLLLSLPWLPWLAPLVRPRARPAGADPVRALMLTWIAVVVVFFSLPASKIVGYVLPVVPPLAWLIAEGWDWAPRTALARRLGVAGFAVSVLIGLAAVAALALQPRRSTRDVAAALAAVRGSDEPVYALGGYPYDLPFYARLQAPLAVVEDWPAPQVRERDDWRRELAEAGDFAPQAAGRILVTGAALPARLCAGGVSWLVATPQAVAGRADLALAESVYRGRETALWKIDSARPALATALNCAQRPSAGWPGK